MLVKDSNSIDINTMRRQSICFNYKEKRYITAQYPKPRKPRKYFRRKLELEKLVDKMIEKKLREFMKR